MATFFDNAHRWVLQTSAIKIGGSDNDNDVANVDLAYLTITNRVLQSTPGAAVYAQGRGIALRISESYFEGNGVGI